MSHYGFCILVMFILLRGPRGLHTVSFLSLCAGSLFNFSSLCTQQMTFISSVAWSSCIIFKCLTGFEDLMTRNPFSWIWNNSVKPATSSCKTASQSFLTFSAVWVHEIRGSSHVDQFCSTKVTCTVPRNSVWTIFSLTNWMNSKLEIVSYLLVMN